MTITSLIVILLVGLIAGWLAGQFVKGGGFGLVGDIVVGIVGALIAGWLFPLLGIPLGGGILGAIISATIGAVILLVIIRRVKRAGPSEGRRPAPLAIRQSPDAAADPDHPSLWETRSSMIFRSSVNRLETTPIR
jgi:uncharacterized membrane protein YeaQ/YmgE (transglycosylase-associated protein family)